MSIRSLLPATIATLLSMSLPAGGQDHPPDGADKTVLKHHILLRRDRNDDSGIFGTLRFMDGRCVSEDYLVEFAERVSYWTAIESNRHLAELEIRGLDVADVAIIDLLLMVGGFRREVQHFGVLRLTRERWDFPSLVAAFRRLSKM